MKNIARKLLCSCLAAILLCLSTVVPIVASDNSTVSSTVSPRYSHCASATITFTVADPGTAHVGVTYYGYTDTFVQAKVTVQIQKRFLGLFWKTVDIGYTNDKWIAYSSDVNGYFYNTFTVDGTGTYRANFTLEITGSDGTVDVIDETIEKKYS